MITLEALHLISRKLSAFVTTKIFTLKKINLENTSHMSCFFKHVLQEFINHAPMKHTHDITKRISKLTVTPSTP